MNKIDELWPGGPKFLHTDDAFKLCTDSVLLAHFTSAPRAIRGVDLGSGAGVLSILLAHKYPNLHIDAIELQEKSAEVSRENIAANGFENRVSIINGDIRDYKTHFTAGAYDLVISNPPYFPGNSGYTAPNPTRSLTRDEGECSLEDVIAAAAFLCRWGGIFTMVHRPERLSEICCIMNRYAIEPKRLRLVSHTAEKAPSLILIEGRRGGKPGLIIDPPLILAQEDGSDSPEVIEIYHRKKDDL